MLSTELPVSRTKVTVPALRPEILHRARLLALFDDLLDKKLIIVAAPAGYGKTTLLVDYARQSTMPVCWLSLDALDKDPQRFCTYLIASLEQRFPKFGHQSKSVLRSLTGLVQDSERLLSALINEIDSTIDEHFALVMDDYQFVDSIPYIRDLFSRFIYLVGENCHVILSSRRLPTLPDITLMVARQQVSGFDLEQLAFRPNEIRSLFEMDYGINLADQVLEELMHQTEGWITGLHLSASASSHGVPDLTRAARTAGVDLAVYLDQQVLAQQPPDLRHFLLLTSLMEEFDAELCSAVLGPGPWKKLIKAIQQNNLFALPVGMNGKTVRYHPLFQEFLRERIREEEPETVQAIFSRLAEAYKERHEWEKAYAIYHESGNPDLLADLVEQAGTPLLVGERLITLQAWLDELPASLIEVRPHLLSLKGAFLNVLGDGRTALTLLDQAILEFEKTNNLNGLVLALVRRAATNRFMGDYAGSLQDADETMRLSESQPSMEILHAEAERLKGLDLYHLGQNTEAIQSLERALRVYERLGEEQSIGRLYMELGMAHKSIGNTLAAFHSYEQALEKFRKGQNVFAQANLLNNLGVIYHEQGEYELAVRAFESGVERARQANLPRQEALLLTSLGDIFIDLDEYESAAHSYTNAAEIVKKIRYQFLANYLRMVQARLARLQGQLKEAHTCLSEVEPLIQAGGSNYECGLFYLESGCLYLVQEKPAGAIARLNKALEYFNKGEMAIEANIARIWLAAACASSRHLEMARSHLKTLFDSIRPKTATIPILQAIRRASARLAGLQDDEEIGPALSPWLLRAIQAEEELPALRKHLRRMLRTVPIQAPHLTIQAFGKPRVRVNGKLVTMSQWKTASVRELFFFILSATHPLTKEEIGATLWPELDANKLKLHFKNDLYRLRHAIGQNIILFENNHYHFNYLLDYDYDVENFTSHLARANNSSHLEERISHLQSATGLRTGPFLQEFDSTWVWPERERLERSCVNALEKLAESQRLAGNLHAALNTCQEALKIDPCREDIHCLAMQLHADLGDRLAVIWQYQACRASLHSELDMIPSNETETLYRRLTG
jgi:LuxR family maltose regulon positive regulatory protein